MSTAVLPAAVSLRVSPRTARIVFVALTVCALLSTLGFGATADRIATMNSGRTVPLRGNMSHKALPEFDRGPVDPAMKMGTMTLLTTPTAAQMKALQQLVAQQQDRKSANYHKWITPAQWADRFGLSVADMAKITSWLKAQGFTGISPANGRNWVSFTGTAAQVQSALGSEIHKYEVNGETHYANASVPQIPAGLAGIVVGFRGLDDFQPRPHNVRRNAQVRPYYNDSMFGDLVAPGDISTIYDVAKLYAAGIDGTGQKLAVAGRTDVYLADLNDFRSGFGLSTISCTPDANGLVTTSCNTTNFRYVLGGTDPGVNLSDITEADLDLEWSGAIAKNAQIIYVNSTDVFGSYYYAIDNVATLGESVISLSYGLCEFGDNQIQTFDEPELMTANSMGITFLNSTGDTGSAECDGPTNTGTTSSNNNLALNGIAVSYPASSPEVTGVGGTAIDASNFTSTYWGTTNGTDGGTALSYIPEISWNDDEAFLAFCTANPTNTFCSGGNGTGVAITTDQLAQNAIGISQGGGGVSNCATQNSTFTQCVSGFPQPSWQSGLVLSTVPAPAVRFSPDVSLLASPNFPGYIFCTPQDAWVSGATVATSTCDPGGTAGITTAIESFTSIVGGTSVSTPVFAGMVALLNQYLVTNNFQTTAGLGNINPALYYIAANNPTAMNQVTTGDSTVYCQSGTPVGQLAALICPTGTNNIGSFGYNATNADPATGYNLVTGLGSVNANTLATAYGEATIATTISITPTSTQIFQGGSETFNIAITPSTATGVVSFFNNGSTTAIGTTTVSAGVTPTFTTTTLPVGTDAITATYNGINAPSMTATASTITVTQPFALTPSATSYMVTPGSTAMATITVTQNGGFNSALTFSCTDPAPESTCTAPAATNATSITIAVTTTAPTSAKNAKPNGGGRLFYAALLPGMLGILFLGGSRKRTVRGVRILGLMMVLGFSTLWLGSCGGGSSSMSNPGTTAGSYTITVNATTGGTNAATGTTTFTLVVQ